jgi:translation initiation factor 2B subunit (eIF-2B alpha/beta/delta family)
MVDPAIIHLEKQFVNLELHAAHSGRAVLSALIQCILKSSASNIIDLEKEVRENCLYLLPSLPPYAPPLNSINQVMLVFEDIELESCSLEGLKHRITLLEANPSVENKHLQIAENLRTVIHENTIVYTHTLSETVLGVLLALKHQTRIKRVYVTESRPNNDGWITAEKLVQAGIDTHLTIDMAFPAAIDQADLMLSGAEIINHDGSVVCKVGVLPASTYCLMTSKPVYILADTKKISTFNLTNMSMTALSPKSMGLEKTLRGLSIFGSYFDITPARYITRVATERGLLTAEEIRNIAREQPVSKWLDSQLQAGTSGMKGVLA